MRSNKRIKMQKADAISALRNPDIAAGFNDAAHDVEFPRAYDEWGDAKQLRYELGRKMGIIFADCLAFARAYVPMDAGEIGHREDWTRLDNFDCADGYVRARLARIGQLRRFQAAAGSESRLGTD